MKTAIWAYLREHVVRAVFNKYADDVMREYLLTDGWQNFKFKPEYDTEEIETHFAALGYNFTTVSIRGRIVRTSFAKFF